MMKEKVLIHFTTNETSVYKLTNGNVLLQSREQLFFNETLVHDEMLNKIYSFVEKIKSHVTNFGKESVRLYATGIFQELSKEEKMQLLIQVFVKTDLYFNIIESDLEQFYIANSEDNDMITGLVKQEFRKVVVCGSFQQNIKEISEIMNIMHEHNTEVLSPWTTNVVPETLGTDFILLEGQELLNDRDAWRHKYDHMNKFKKADAIIVCNPNGIIGKGTMFEFGFMIAHQKRIIFTEPPKDLSILFPYEIGLNL